MRVRIIAPVKETSDGIDLRRFTVGYVYAVGTAVGNYLLASGTAQPVPDENPALILPLQQQMFGRPDVERRRSPEIMRHAWRRPAGAR